jgi:DNA-binding NarL/FixJ family response regulator/HPt (histidine-containing phosphotransfer) domain-containing protein
VADISLRVLIVDDNPGDARLVEIGLSKEPGFQIHCERAPRVSAAVERLARGDIDAVLLDLGLPDSEGTAGLRKIRAAAPQTAVVVLSGSDNPQMAVAAVAAGAQDYLVKGIFPRGYLARTLRLASLIRAIEVGIEDGRPVSPDALRELDESHIGAAVLSPHGVSVWNAAFSELTGFVAPGETPKEIPAWMQRMIASVPGSPTAAPSASAAPGPAPDIGQFAIAADAGPGATLEYSLRRFPNIAFPHALLLLRRAEPHRRASHRAAPPGEVPLIGTTPSAAVRLDAETWENLRELAGTDTNFLPSLVSAFATEGQRLTGSLQAAADDADGPRIGRLAHTLRSTCAQLGALDLARMCSALEAQSETGNLPESRALILQIAHGFSEVSDELRKRYPPRS